MKWDVDANTFPKWRLTLLHFGIASSRLITQNDTKYLTTSIWVSTKEDEKYAEQLQHGIKLGVDYFIAAIDMYFSFLGLIEKNPISSSACALLRCLLENTANILYLYEDSITITERYKRCCISEIKEIRQMKHYIINRLRDTASPSSQVVEQVSELEDREKHIREEATLKFIRIDEADLTSSYTNRVEKFLK